MSPCSRCFTRHPCSGCFVCAKDNPKFENAMTASDCRSRLQTFSRALHARCLRELHGSFLATECLCLHVLHAHDSIAIVATHCYDFIRSHVEQRLIQHPAFFCVLLLSSRRQSGRDTDGTLCMCNSTTSSSRRSTCWARRHNATTISPWTVSLSTFSHYRRPSHRSYRQPNTEIISASAR